MDYGYLEMGNLKYKIISAEVSFVPAMAKVKVKAIL